MSHPLNTYVTHLPHEESMLVFAGKLARALPKACVIYLNGPLGAGKTTLVRGVLHALGYEGKVKSPTYTLIEQYEVNGQIIIHLDLYRIHHLREVIDMGLEDYFLPEAICLIEWPEKGFSLLPAQDLTCYIDFEGAGRCLRLESLSKCGEEMISRLF